ncbi:MAG: hypothetical protein WD648_01790 [Planctomycetaceae bacterium]
MTAIIAQLRDGRSIVHLIGWFSTCLVIAGWGPAIDPAVRNVWASSGLVGLSAALILQGAYKVTQSHARERQQATAEKRMQRNVKTLEKQAETAKSVELALREIIEDAESTRTASHKTREDAGKPLYRPVRVTRAGGPWSKPFTTGNAPMTAKVRDLSVDGIGLEHDRPIKMEEVILGFDMNDGRSRSFLVDLVWCSLRPNGKYWSRGKVLNLQASKTSNA